LVRVAATGVGIPTASESWRPTSRPMVSIAAGADYLAYAGTRGDELYCRLFCFDTAEKACAMQAWIDASDIESRPAPGPSNFPQLKVGRRS
jgi:hypothetical protein